MVDEKNSRLNLRVSVNERTAIHQLASENGLSTSEYIRKCILQNNDRPVIQTDVNTLKELYANQRRIGGLLNQLLKHANSRRQDFPSLVPQVQKTLDELSATSEQINEFIQLVKRSL